MATCPSGHESASDDFCDVCGYLIGAPPSFGPGQAGSSQRAEATVSATVASPGAATGAATVPPGAACPRCGAPRYGQFCEACGYDFATPAAAQPMSPAPVSPGLVSPGPVSPGPVPPGPVLPGTPPQTRSTAAQPVPGTPGTPGTQVTAGAGSGWTAVVTADRAYYDSVQAEGGPDAPGIAFPAYYPERRFRLSGPEVRIGRHSAHSGIDPEIDLAIPPADPGVSRLHAVLIRAADGTWSVIDPGSANGTLVNGREIASDQAVPLHDGDRIHLGAWTELRVFREA